MSFSQIEIETAQQHIPKIYWDIGEFGAKTEIDNWGTIAAYMQGSSNSLSHCFQTFQDQFPEATEDDYAVVLDAQDVVECNGCNWWVEACEITGATDDEEPLCEDCVE